LEIDGEEESGLDPGGRAFSTCTTTSESTMLEAATRNDHFRRMRQERKKREVGKRSMLKLSAAELGPSWLRFASTHGSRVML